MFHNILLDLYIWLPTTWDLACGCLLHLSAKPRIKLWSLLQENLVVVNEKVSTIIISRASASRAPYLHITGAQNYQFGKRAAGFGRTILFVTTLNTILNYQRRHLCDNLKTSTLLSWTRPQMKKKDFRRRWQLRNHSWATEQENEKATTYWWKSWLPKFSTLPSYHWISCKNCSSNCFTWTYFVKHRCQYS